jgi:hypothetical protein
VDGGGAAVAWLSDRRAERERKAAERRKDEWRQEVEAFAQERAGISPVELLRGADATVYRLGALMTAADTRASTLTREQRAKCDDRALLDSLLAAGLPPGESYLAEAVEIRRIGRRLHDEGGYTWMLAVAARTIDIHRVSLHRISRSWDGIGR